MSDAPGVSAAAFQRELDRVVHRTVRPLLSVFFVLYGALVAATAWLGELPRAAGKAMMVSILLLSAVVFLVTRALLWRYALAPSRSHHYVSGIALVTVVTSSARLFLTDDPSLTIAAIVMTVLWGLFVLKRRLLLAIQGLQLLSWIVIASVSAASTISWIRFGLALLVATGLAHVLQRFRLRGIRGDLEQRVALTRALADVQASRDAESVARAAAERASREKSAALTLVSHELRTPLDAIVKLARKLHRGRLSAEQRADVERVRDAGEALLHLVNDLLDLARIEAGTLDIERVPLAPRRVVDGVVGLMRAQAEARGVELHATLDPGLPERVSGDPARLRQVLINLVGDAIESVERGHVSIDVALVRASDELVEVRFEVVDSDVSGADARSRGLLDAFARVAGDPGRLGGAGLGLSICKKLTELMGGQIGVERGLGQGVTVWFQLPMGHAEPEALAPGVVVQGGASAVARAPAAAHGRSLSVLVAEAHAMNRRVIERLVTSLGHRVTLVENGARAQAELEARRYDVVLMDVEMPVLDGETATRRIRALERARALTDETPVPASIPIIAMTARVSDEERERCLAAGVDEYLSKPLDRQRLVEVLRGVVR